jgi:hypothetical protein
VSGRREQFVVMKPPGRGRVSHSPDCAFLLGCQAKGASDYRVVPARAVPRQVPRCSHCGGGR